MSGLATNMDQLELGRYPLRETTNETGDSGESSEGPDPKDVNRAMVAEAGWSAPEAYDYSRYIGEAQATDENGPPWAQNSKRYEWDDEYGDIGPAHPELEKELFQEKKLSRKGDFMDNYWFNIEVESLDTLRPVRKFEDAGLHPVMYDNLKLCGYEFPTPIQSYTFPAVKLDHDIIAIAQTGSGKTAAYLVPILSKLMGKAKKLCAKRPSASEMIRPDFNGVKAEPLVLIVVPTRELAVQVFDDARRYCYRSMFRPCVAYGGGPYRSQMDELQRGCDVLIGTPGRLIDYMSRPTLLSMRRLKYTVLDEADELIGPDWEEDINRILGGGDNNDDADHRYLMFAATFPKEARNIAREYMSSDHIRIRVGRAGSSHKNILQSVVKVGRGKKKQMLLHLLLKVKPARTVIFVNNKNVADELDDFLFNMGFPCTSLHSDRLQREREDALRAFRIGKAPVLIATGVSARGVDVPNVMHVINYDLPSVSHGGIDEYINRIGRTARIGHEGLATSFYCESQDEDLGEALVKVLLECKQKVPVFLEHLKPAEGEEIDFDDKSSHGDKEKGDNDKSSAAGDVGAWGAGGDEDVHMSDDDGDKDKKAPRSTTPVEAADSSWGGGGTVEESW